jgi:low affinity Fe/Cu permease
LRMLTVQHRSRLGIESTTPKAIRAILQKYLRETKQREGSP